MRTRTRAGRQARGRVLALGLLAALLAVPGCGDRSAGDGEVGDDPGASPPGEGAPRPATPSTPGPLPTQEPPSGPPTTPSDAGTRLRLVGVVVAVADDHVVLRDGNGTTWALLGQQSWGLRVEQRVQVTGTSRPDLSREGRPVVVVERVAEAPRS